jgi:hypothetical protein
MLLNSADAVFAGANGASKIYMGTDLVWSGQPPAPPVPTDSLKGWYSADSLSLSDGAQVTSLPPVSGYGPTMSAPGGKPTFKQNAANGLPSLRFSGAQYVSQSNASSDRFSIRATATTNYLYMGGRRLDADSWTKLLTTQAPATAPPPSLMRATANWGSGSGQFHINGVEVASGPWTSAGSTSNTASGDFRIGSSSNSSYLNGEFFEMLLYERILSPAEIAQVENYLTNKWIGKVFTDDFNRADLGSDWDTFGDGWNIDTGALRPPLSSSRACAYIGGQTNTDDMWAELDVTDWGNGSANGVLARWDGGSTSTGNGYFWRFYYNYEARMYSVVNGSYVAIGDLVNLGPLAAPQTLRIECEGDQIRGYVGGVLYQTITDSSVPTGRGSGIRGNGTTTRLDNFKFGDLGTVAP